MGNVGNDPRLLRVFTNGGEIDGHRSFIRWCAGLVASSTLLAEARLHYVDLHDVHRQKNIELLPKAIGAKL